MRVLLLIFLLSSMRVAATPLPPIQVEGNLWLQPIDFLGFTWEEVHAVCDPMCNGSLGGVDLSGWNWANTEDLNALFNYYIGSPEMGPGPDQYIVEDRLALGLEFLAAGWIPTVFDNINLSQAAIGYMSDTPDRVGVVGGAYSRTGGVSATRTDYTSSFYGPENTGVWLTRASVPIPATPLLMSFAFLIWRLLPGKRSRYRNPYQ